jgi:hypothetical protein
VWLCWSLREVQESRELCDRVMPPIERSLHAPFIASRRYRVTRCWCMGDPCRGSSPRVSGGLIRWRRGLYCTGMALVLLALLLHGEAYVPLLRE